ncbi:MAG: hypothetical protein V3W34_11640 [Phycisphaerae bacterium]
MNEEFLTVFRILGVYGDGNGTFGTNEELIARMRADTGYQNEERAFMEMVLTTVNRGVAEQLLSLLHSTARYVSDLIRGDVPVLVSRDDIVQMAAGATSRESDALRLGRSVERAIRNQVAVQSERHAEQLLSQIQELFNSAATGFVPPSGKLLNTDGIAARTGLAVKTVRRLCNEGKIDADKTGGGEWRTTEDRLQNSHYFKRRRNGNGAELE